MLVQIFAKAPVAGKVKTRLAASVGDDVAAEFARLLLHYLIKHYQKEYKVELWVAGDVHHPAFDIAKELRLPVFSQTEGDLGEKMLHAANQGLSRSDKIVIVGSDCLGVNNQLLAKVYGTLNGYDAVFSPADDGGFVLFAANKNLLKQHFVFGDVAWGNKEVWLQTQKALADSKVPYCAVDESWDIDTIEDIKKYYHQLPKLLHQFLEENSILIG